MQTFVPGQRWISDTELQLGLGTVQETDQRTVTIRFPASSDTRIYAKQTAPLTRVAFAAGDVVRHKSGYGVTLSAAREDRGLLHYSGMREDGSRIDFAETELDHHTRLNKPVDRLFSGQIDADKWFELRAQTRQHAQRLAHSDLIGLTGARTSLLPHQLFIAHEVARRYAPRVLLADEVGLGKTIEAGLILHQQWLSERARRILIVVPEPLLHQWLVEMLRRFNLSFSIFDAERCDAMEESLEAHETAQNPFFSAQLVLCSLGFLVREPLRCEQAVAGAWDLLVVDEAHHLQWTPQETSTEYTVIETLAAQTKGVLLLTATPEQLGKASHFARLRLLDPDRFPDYDAFVAEEQHYAPIARTIEELFDAQPLSAASLQTLRQTLSEGDNHRALATLLNPAADIGAHSRARRELIDHLLDRHGTGRVLYRNTRAAVQGFPSRRPHGYPLPLPEAYAQCLDAMRATTSSDIRLLPCPERLYQQGRPRGAPPWTAIDPRLPWLGAQLRELRPDKVLVIAAHAATALELAEALRSHFGIHAAVFHEGMPIVERDRAAAYFADQESGTQVMICSEIGSEGRNFQFAHHLVLFDLPLNPDLLEQRIGRLDRIGQRHSIDIHVPWLENSAQALLFHWYHRGLDAFTHTCPAGHSVYMQMEGALLDTLQQPAATTQHGDALILATQQLHRQLNDMLARGRDRLLEYHSCRPEIANALRDRAAQQDQRHSPQDYLQAVFDCYGIDIEEHSAQRYIVRPTEHMPLDSFPGLPTDGMTVTFDRNTALSYEDVAFLTWEHPLVSGAMDLLINNEQGNTAVTAIRYPKLPAGTLLLECSYLLDAADNATLDLRRYLPTSSLRVLIDSNGNNRAALLNEELINRSRISLDSETVVEVVKSQVAVIRRMLAVAERQALQQMPPLIGAARAQGSVQLQEELNRLRALQCVNPNVRDEEIDFFAAQLRVLEAALDAVTPRLDAVRLIVTT